jgi:hypothetical protein
MDPGQGHRLAETSAQVQSGVSWLYLQAAQEDGPDLDLPSVKYRLLGLLPESGAAMPATPRSNLSLSPSLSLGFPSVKWVSSS